MKVIFNNYAVAKGELTEYNAPTLSGGGVATKILNRFSIDMGFP